MGNIIRRTEDSKHFSSDQEEDEKWHNACFTLNEDKNYALFIEKEKDNIISTSFKNPEEPFDDQMVFSWDVFIARTVELLEMRDVK